jgi:hypothetical protein
MTPKRESLHLPALIVVKANSAVRSVALVLRMTQPAGRLRVPPHPPPRPAGVRSMQTRTSYIRAIRRIQQQFADAPNVKRARLGAKPGSSTVDAK